jgi:ribonucleotide reductase beta subunit family protein with ferritin-like domain
MLIGLDERTQFARLLGFLAQGERVAHECAQAQAALAPREKMRRFFLKQAQQEAIHVKVFQSAIAWLAPRQLPCPPLAAMNRYQHLLQRGIEQRNLAETLLGGQIILEGLGEVVLNHIQAGLGVRKAGFDRIVRVLLTQEETHHAFGCSMLERTITDSQVCLDTLRRRSVEYLSLTDAMLFDLGDLFEYFGEDQNAYALETRGTLPDWLA